MTSDLQTLWMDRCRKGSEEHTVDPKFSTTAMMAQIENWIFIEFGELVLLDCIDTSDRYPLA